ncbi:hypothetical protein COCC4DRAFT_133281 [Bipolaris maydis ATCC 48331]|uniref:Mid2 domain-containing protein n=2 Tax=Cochliobolus heterostrophus TaxID=5016 RepID=M2UZU6_COCH5|nr:uncharacterized protein COCC4DRAFT_133281 [Bipolaris maydis ATCC 48331]EMD93232.1 hypothetical protein COCHEDRAFT_1097159 [Bipolaris maydis C5]KAJ5027572.1 hypothetical protein J3E73DRAFT_408281 [Bipolaris maydis]ENI07321.1 hypothetical protein COCC4DRAFT_133281 [Bipolaris maydis ATCC 48331]KAJ6266783.1 hypothetical protein PSV08DRAFT_381563 [Bipolaris maydis]KAJ6282881.1 hypothetical protein J3E71DRAFT_378045 [Bipolaris maydis]
MTTALFTLASLAPAIANAVALLRATPEPTHFVPSMDIWNPAPTAAAQLPLSLFKRQASGHDYTCGFVSGSPDSPVTCENPTQTCATNTYFGIHGCCDPASNTPCTLPTSCIAFTAMTASCTETACSSNEAIVKCTSSTAQECYEWNFIYDNMVMTQHGCAETAFTSTAYRSPGMRMLSSSNKETEERETVTATVTMREIISGIPTLPAVAEDKDTTTSSEGRKTSLEAVIGGTVGACVFVCFLAFVVFLAWRRRRNLKGQNTQCYQQQQSMVEYHAAVYEDTDKAWDQQCGVVACEREICMGDGVGVVEMDGTQRPVEAPTREK